MTRQRKTFSRTVTVNDLKAIPEGVLAMLYCIRCGEQYSATPGDYFMSDPNTVFRCCGLNMRLVTKHEVYINVPLAR